MALDMEIKGAIEDASKAFNDALKEVKKSQTDMAEKLAAFEEKGASAEDLTDITGRVEDERKKMEALGETVTDLTKKMAKRDQGNMSAARAIVSSKGFSDNIREGKSMEFKDITSAAGGTVTIPSMAGSTNRGVLMPVDQQLFLRDLLPSMNTDSPNFYWVQELLYTNAAAIVAEGAAKPQSDITFELKQGAVKKMAHWFQVSEEALDDISMMEGYINQRGIYGLRKKEEEQLLSGDGTATQLDGLLNNSTAYLNTTVPGVVPVNAMDDLLVAITQIAEADLMASGVVMNHLDVAALRLEKDADGKYLHPAFTGGSAWGLPIVSTKGLAQGSFMVGGFQGNVLVHQRKGIEVRKSTEHGTNFTDNMVTILMEERLGLEVARPAGIVSGAFT